jgi:flavin-dependent dehydrogenase
MDAGLFDRFVSSEKKLIGTGVHFFGPEHQKVTIRAANKIGDKMTEVALCRRLDFDNFLYEEIKKHEYIDIIQNENVTDLIKDSGGINIICSDQTFSKTKLLILATGSHHALVHKLNGIRQPKKQMAAGIRTYFENINGLNPEGYIELHFLKELAPGYLWIFPLTRNQANVGLGLRSDIVSKRKIDLRQMLKNYINDDPYFRERFKNAHQLSDISGFPLALGVKNRSISGDHYLLSGDAANLIEPLFGEGIGHAMYSGKFAAEHAIKCINGNNYSAIYNRQYDQAVYQKLGSTLSFSKMMHTLASYPGIIRFIINRVRKDEDLEYMFTQLINGNITKIPANGLRFIIKLLTGY